MANSVSKSNKLAKQICDNSKYRYLYGANGELYTKSLVNKFAGLFKNIFTPSLKKEALKDADKGYRAYDCSGFVCKVLGISKRSSSELYSTAVKTYAVDKAKAKPGMVLWRSGHVAYIGEGLSIYEASSTATDMKISKWENRAKSFTKMIIVKGSALDK